MKSDIKYDVAISFAGEDRDFARRLADEMKKYKLSVFFDEFEKSKLWGKDLYTYLLDVYQNQSKLFIPLLSKNYINKTWPKHELKAAQIRALEEKYEYILPVKLDSIDIPEIPSTTGYLECPPETAISITHQVIEKLRDIPILPEVDYEKLSSPKKKRDINIFTFGNIASGKTTLHASLITTMMKNKEGLFKYDHKNFTARYLLLDWLENIRNQKFPARSPKGELVEIDVGINSFSKQEPKEIEKQLNLRFTEISGEDLREIEYTHVMGNWHKDSLLKTDIILIVIPINYLKDDQYLISCFLEYLCASGIHRPISIILTKWDLKKDESSLEEIIKQYLRWPLLFIQKSGIYSIPKVFYFSIGIVQENSILEYNPLGANDILNWIKTDNL